MSSSVTGSFKCSKTNEVDKKLICTKCEEFIKQNNKDFSPCNIIMCTYKSHIPSHPTSKEIRLILEKLYPSILLDKVRFPVHQAVNSVKSDNQRTRAGNQVETLSRKTPLLVDTCSGEIKNITSEKVVNEVREKSSFILQLLKIGQHEVLTMFDTGADMHLMDGAIAESESLEKLSDRSTTLTVIGGGNVGAEYGVYRVFLGPTPQGEYREVIAQGIEQVTGVFNEIDLTIVNNELTSLHEEFKSEILPQTIGGGRAKLILGLKDLKLHPKEVFIQWRQAPSIKPYWMRIPALMRHQQAMRKITHVG